MPPFVAPPYAAQAHPASHQQPQPTYSQPAYQGYRPGPATVYPPAPVWPAQPIYDPNQAYQQAQYQPQPTQPYAHPPPLYAPQEPLGYYDVNGGFVPHNVPHSQPFTESIAHTSRPDEDDHVGSHTRNSSYDIGLDFEGEVGLTAEEIDENLSLGLIGESFDSQHARLSLTSIQYGILLYQPANRCPVSPKLKQVGLNQSRRPKAPILA